MSAHTITLTVNGVAHTQEVEARLTLADLLRERLDLTATHLGCEHGVCGACTVIVDGHAARSCTTLAVQADGAEIRTLEGVAGDGGELHPVQQAFWEKHGMQCGFCTPGIVMSLVELLEREPDPSAEAIAEVLSGHLCRCTGYVKIREAAEEAVRLVARARSRAPTGKAT
jgi:carbon-monoxide dehydrogenase small subunit